MDMRLLDLSLSAKGYMQRFGLLLLLLFSSVPISALELGAIQVDSHLSEPLRAFVPVNLNASDELASIQISLADREAFDRQGLSYSPYLSNLQFKLSGESGLRHTLSITSSQPVRESYLDFLVKITWNGGTFIRQYKLLLDPLGADKRSLEEPLPSKVPEMIVVPSTKSGGESHYGPVARDESISMIAQGLSLHERYSVYQIMRGLYLYNPDAFENGNIDSLRVGSTLKIPDIATIEELPRSGALKFVLSVASDYPRAAVQPAAATRGSPTTEIAAEVPSQPVAEAPALPLPEPLPQSVEVDEMPETQLSSLPSATPATETAISVEPPGVETPKPSMALPVESTEESAMEGGVEGGAELGESVLRIAPMEGSLDKKAFYPEELGPLLVKVIKDTQRDVEVINNLSTEFGKLTSTIEAQSVAIEELNLQLAEKDQVIAGLSQRIDALEGVPDMLPQAQEASAQAEGLESNNEGVLSEPQVIKPPSASVSDQEAAIPVKVPMPKAVTTEEERPIEPWLFWLLPLLAVATILIIWGILNSRKRSSARVGSVSELHASVDADSEQLKPWTSVVDLPDDRSVPLYAVGEGNESIFDTRPSEGEGATSEPSNLTEMHKQIDVLIAYHDFDAVNELINKAEASYPDDPWLKVKRLEILAHRKETDDFFNLLSREEAALSGEHPVIWGKLLELGRKLDSLHPMVAHTAFDNGEDLDEEIISFNAERSDDSPKR